MNLVQFWVTELWMVITRNNKSHLLWTAVCITWHISSSTWLVLKILKCNVIKKSYSIHPNQKVKILDDPPPPRDRKWQQPSHIAMHQKSYKKYIFIALIAIYFVLIKSAFRLAKIRIVIINYYNYTCLHSYLFCSIIIYSWTSLCSCRLLFKQILSRIIQRNLLSHADTQ